jgi:DNA-binding SARP family transcriptional activator
MRPFPSVARMEIRLLGPVQILDADGDVVALRRRKERLALSVLLLEPGRVVDVDRLVDLLWETGPPASVRATLQALMSRIRAALRNASGVTRPMLRAQGSGYVLEIEPAAVDLHLFRTMVARAHETAEPHVRSARLTAALDLWRGPALAGTATGAVRHRLCAELDESRFAALSDRVDADLAAGRHAGLVAELSRLAATYPLRERFHGQLMLALYRSGRRAEALLAYRRASRMLAAELSLTPGPLLRRLHADILGDAPSLSGPLSR